MAKKATIKARNELFKIIEMVNKGELVGFSNPKLIPAAKEFEEDGLIKLHNNCVCERLFA
jgi:hypothetical protein